MKKVILVLWLIPLFATAQQPFGKNATWTYSIYGWGGNGFMEVKYEKDTLLYGHVWQEYTTSGQKMVRSGPGPNDYYTLSAGIGKQYLLVRNDSVFRKNTNNTPELLYDMNARIGDSWQFAPIDSIYDCKKTPIATVVGIGYDTLNGFPFKYYDIENQMDTFYFNGPSYQYQCASGWCLAERIYVDFGSVLYHELFWPAPNLCNGGSFMSGLNSLILRCFSNNTKSVNFTSQACNFYSGIGIVEDNQVALKIYPNPSNGFVVLETETGIAQTEIYDLAGRKVAMHQTQKTIELPHAKGIYFLHITLKNGLVVIEKVLRD